MVGQGEAKLMIPRYMYLLFILIESRTFDRKQELKIAIDSTQVRKTDASRQLVQVKGIPEYTLKILSPQKLFLKSHVA